MEGNAKNKLMLIVADCSTDPNVREYLDSRKDIKKIYFDRPTPTGCMKTSGATLAFLKDVNVQNDLKYIYFSNDDMYFFPNWDGLMIEALIKYDDLVIVGGKNIHGGDQPREINKDYNVKITHNQSGYSQMFRMVEWRQVNFMNWYDEDSWISYQMKGKFNKEIGVIDPPIILHCGKNRIFVPEGVAGGADHPIDIADILNNEKKYPEILFG